MLGLVGICVARRWPYPFELSWMEGCLVDHARRAASGKPLYGPPSCEFIPLLYAPISHYVASWFIRAGLDGFLAVRAVSILGILGAILVGMWLVARATRHQLICLLVPALVASTYFDVDTNYDIGRPDNLMVFFFVLAVGALSLRSLRVALPMFLIAALGAIYTKQSAVILIAVLLMGLLLIRWQLAVLGALTLPVTVGVVFACFQQETRGWFYVYTVELPSHHGLTHTGLVNALSDDFLGSFILTTTAVILSVVVVTVTRSRSNLPPDPRCQRFRLLLIATIAAATYSALSRWNIGGAANVLVPYAVMGSLFLPVAVASAAEQLGNPVRRAIGWRLGMLVLCFAVAGGLRDFRKYLPTPQDEINWRRFQMGLARYGPPERIWVLCHGAALGAGVSDPMRPHLAAMSDYVGGAFGTMTGRKLPEDLFRLVRQRYFHAIVVLEDYPPIWKWLETYYEPDDSPPVTLPLFSTLRLGSERILVPKENR
jgi:hypothetical protein